MANPSLQIGNDNWAIKEDNLLGYSTAGSRFVPQPITMTRATLGTRVNPSGLVEDVALLGSELVTNGDFTELPLGTGWDAYTSGSSTVAFTEGAVLSIDGSNSNVGVYQQNIFTSGVQYKIVVSVKATASFDALVSETDAASSKGTIGTLNLTTSYQDFSFYYTGTGTWDLFIHRKYGETAGQNQQIYVKSVSVKEATIDNLPRVDYTDGTSSLLVEPQRTNLITYSEDFSSWNKLAAVVTTNQTTSPSGTLTADKITYDGTTYGRVEQTVAVTNGNTYSWSVYLKNNDLSDVTQVWLGFSQAGQGEFVTITNEWQRYETVQVANGSNEYPRVQFTGTGSLYAWGAQIEQGSYPTSYIKTSGSTVTRNQETYTKTGISNLINSEEGVLFVEIAALANDGEYRQILLHDNAYNNRIALRYMPSSNQINVYLYSGTVQSDLYYNLSNALDFNKIAFKYQQNNFSLYVNGVEVGADTSGTTFSANTLQKVDFDFENNYFFYGKVRQLQIFKTALSDSELATLTT